MDCFIKSYRRVEAFTLISLDEFLLKSEVRGEAIKAIKELAACIKSLSKAVLKVNANDPAEISAGLAKAGIITWAVAEELAGLLKRAEALENEDPALIYSDLVRFMEVFEEAYVQLKRSRGGLPKK